MKTITYFWLAAAAIGGLAIATPQPGHQTPSAPRYADLDSHAAGPQQPRVLALAAIRTPDLGTTGPVQPRAAALATLQSPDAPTANPGHLRAMNLAEMRIRELAAPGLLSDQESDLQVAGR